MPLQFAPIVRRAQSASARPQAHSTAAMICTGTAGGMTRRRFRMEAFRTSGRFSAWLARMGRCANLRQNGGHHPTHLPWGDRTPFGFPRQQGVESLLACQIQLVHHQDKQPTPEFKLGRSAHMHPRPEQLLLEKAVAMFLGEASTILLSNLWQGDDRIEHHKPTHPRIALGAFGRVSLNPDHREVQLPVLLEKWIALRSWES